MIYILSAPIRSGKTTSLVHWTAEKDDAFGILTPVENGKRFFMNVKTREQFPMEASGNEETLSVGRFVFSKDGFEKAIQIIRDAMHKQGWLVIDEIGPLELRGEGFCEVLKEILAERNEKILLVAREGMAENLKKQFGIDTAKTIKEIALIRSE